MVEVGVVLRVVLPVGSDGCSLVLKSGTQDKEMDNVTGVVETRTQQTVTVWVGVVPVPGETVGLVPAT